MPKFCINCGTKLEDTMQFCPECGKESVFNPGINKENIVTLEKQPDSVLLQRTIEPLDAQTQGKKSQKGKWALLLAIIITFATGMGYWYYSSTTSSPEVSTNSTTTNINSTTTSLDSKKQEIETKKTPIQQVQDEFQKNRIPGKVIATTYGHNHNGYLVLVENQGDKYYFVDTKNNIVGTFKYIAGVDQFLYSAVGTNKGPLKFTFTIDNATIDQDQSVGAWQTGSHILPVSIRYDVSTDQTITPGMIYAGRGSTPSLYKDVLQEQRYVDITNLILLETRYFYDQARNANKYISES